LCEGKRGALSVAPPHPTTHPPPQTKQTPFSTKKGPARAARPLAGGGVQYEDLEAFADVVDIRALWHIAGLPPPPPILCHVGLVGWHCHNTSINPWHPESILPRAATPPMPANASCIVCPKGWAGPRGSMLTLTRQLPGYLRSKGAALPQGMYDGTKLAAAAAAASSAAANATAAALAPAAAATAAKLAALAPLAAHPLAAGQRAA
jgi:hypothetical protein